MAGQGFAFLLALLIGVSLGALGSGGSIVTYPEREHSLLRGRKFKCSTPPGQLINRSWFPNSY